ncbi:hypothetical protein QFC21_003792 [Naganishia friedmannii]|uniref:Uncharacterized protein n=1 Tax=Naganishia friedmannii TaxID=89922 RepID=A0ACC2VLC0_9TREE|nr:hypothetical protein QFC21_003792 [Naganishia friedmannii]
MSYEQGDPILPVVNIVNNKAYPVDRTSVEQIELKDATEFVPTDHHQSPKEHSIAPFAKATLARTFARLESRRSGLYESEAALLLAKHGPNELSSSRGPSDIILFFNAFSNPFNFLLVVLAAISIGTGDRATFTVMVVMVSVSTVLRFVQERKSIMATIKLVSMVSSKVNVFRHPGSPSHAAATDCSYKKEVDRKEIVPGDVIEFAAGDVFPGDGILISSHAVQISQSALTGEVLPVDKFHRSSGPDPGEAFEPLHDPNVVLQGTSVTCGSGTALVCLTGDATYMASMAKLLKEKPPANAFEIGIRKVSYLLIGFMLIMSPIVLVIRGVLSKDWKNSALFAISVGRYRSVRPVAIGWLTLGNTFLAVGLTPEMLPMIVNGNLAIGARNLAKRKVIVKRLDAVQNLGAMVSLGFQSGVLVTNFAGNDSPRTAKLAHVNASLQTGSRSALDAALTGLKIPGDPSAALTKRGEGDTRRMLSIAIHDDQHKGIIITKGAVEEVLNKCTRLELPDQGTVDVTESSYRAVLDTAKGLNSQGLRLIAIAVKLFPEISDIGLETQDEVDLTFVGFCTFLDPPKEDAADAIAALKERGVDVKILTGDAPEVTFKVARDIGLITGDECFDDVVLSGKVLAGMTKAELDTVLNRIVIFAKLSPYQKLKVVQALRASGKVTGFLGDGVNDALALRGADVGISVDSGTEIAKDAAAIILLEKDLNCVVEGVHIGRLTLVQTLKYIKIAASSNFGNVFSVLVASAWLPYLPMTPLQILLQNLLYDLSQASIPWDNVDPEMTRLPRSWEHGSILKFMICFGPTSSIFDSVTFSTNWWLFGIRNVHNTWSVSQAQTHWFIEGFMTQLFIVYSLRTPKIPFLQSRPSRAVLATTLTMAAIAMAMPFIPPIRNALEMATPHGLFYPILVGILIAYQLFVHVMKLGYLELYKGDWI